MQPYGLMHKPVKSVSLNLEQVSLTPSINRYKKKEADDDDD